MTNLKFRDVLLASTVIAGMSISAPAFAQEQTGDTASETGLETQASAAPVEENSEGEIVVTGTLIRNPNLVASSPVAVVGQEEIQLRQSNNAEEILRDLPGAVPSIGSAVNNGNGGAAFADLRGLGNFRNLVLLDGARITPSSTVGRVDLNNIPLALVERVDTLTGGAATTYGADAVSGVINFITRRDFAGMELNVSNQISERGDGNIFRADLTVGANFEDGRGNAVLSVGYQQADPVYQGARKFSQNNYTSTSGNAGGSGTTVPSRFTLGSVFNSIVPGSGTLRPYVGSRDAFNFNPYNIFQTPFERFNIFGAAHYEVADNIEVYTRGMFSKNTVNTIIAPSGIFSSVLVIPVSNPFLPAGARAQFCANNDFNPNLPGVQTITPAECAAAATALSPTDPNFRAFTTTVGRRTTELGPRESEFQTTMFDYKAGVRIGLSDSIDLDVSGAYGESENTQNQMGYVLTSRIRTAAYTTSATTCNLGASPVINNPNPALPPLAQPGAGTSAGTGCVPVNLFGPDGSITPEMIPYLTADAGTKQRASLAQARILLSGDFGASAPWAEDPIGFAVGTEYRRYTGEQVADVLSQSAGELGGAGGAVLNFDGGYEVYEGYGELIAPLVQDKPFFRSLTVEGGIRYSSYKVDAPGTPKYNTTTWKAAANWEPVNGLRLRGNYQRAVRAPNINELFAPTVVGLTNLATDPCRGTRPIGNAALTAVCLLQGAPASSIGSIGNPTAAQANGTFSGSLALRPETADSYTVGVVFQPQFVPGLSVTVDYYHIRIKNAITQPTPDDIVSGCFGDSNGSAITAASVNNLACQLFRRDPVTGQLSGDPGTTGGLVFPVSNSGRILTDGIDVGVNYRRDLGFAKLNLSFQGNYTRRSQFQATVPGSLIPPGFPGAGGPLAESEVRECTGYYSPNCGSPGSAGPNSAAGSLQPEFSWNQRTTLTFGDVDLSLLWRHVSKMKVEPDIFPHTYNCESGGDDPIPNGALEGECLNFSRMKAHDVFDLAFRFGVSENFDLTATVINLFDKRPPIVGSTIGSTSFNSGNTYPSTYDALGRRFAMGARLKF
ncbi:TonB-dependent receptor domain-containing protein [Sphingosinicella sp. BN140058]|uniref:TonB-dependent receptor domain-containing protein n=1 Tax=Sphingosinicella sp. BN140058 TaxID=1892855 RepID=UPI0010136EDF|nr:TonB-dependent receptor [Sphingosinicella sp. BN140058]QAY77094.1 TonB-dependent receptor [Sphingosinicella sp. BN140058]